MDSEDYLTIMTILTLVFCGILLSVNSIEIQKTANELNIFYYEKYKTKYFDSVNSYQLYNKLDNESFGINGIYFQDSYYCVWLRGRNVTQVQSTETHEACHHLVYQSYDHFCK